jgi:hypothetical protein
MKWLLHVGERQKYMSGTVSVELLATRHTFTSTRALADVFLRFGEESRSARPLQF